MADDLYLDGSHLLHRHNTMDEGRLRKVGLLLWAGDTCPKPPAEGHELVTPVQVHAFDHDALAAHDDAVRLAADQGEGPPPLLSDGEWEWAMLAPLDPGQTSDEARVLAGWDAEGVFHRYCSTVQLARTFRNYAERGL